MNGKCLRCGRRLFVEEVIIHSLFSHDDNTIKEHYCLNCGNRPNNGHSTPRRFPLESRQSHSIVDTLREERLCGIEKLARIKFG